MWQGKCTFNTCSTVDGESPCNSSRYMLCLRVIYTWVIWGSRAKRELGCDTTSGTVLSPQQAGDFTCLPPQSWSAACSPALYLSAAGASYFSLTWERKSFFQVLPLFTRKKISVLWFSVLWFLIPQKRCLFHENKCINSLTPVLILMIVHKRFFCRMGRQQRIWPMRQVTITSHVSSTTFCAPMMLLFPPWMDKRTLKYEWQQENMERVV